MGRACTVCEHPDRASVELGLANRVPVRVLGKRHSLSKESLYRHRKAHMPPQLIAQLMTRGRTTDVDLEKLRITESEGLLQHLVAQRGRLYRMIDMSEDTGDYGMSLRAHMGLLKNLELTGKLLGDLRTGDTQITQNILINPLYHEVRVALVKALKPFPDARTSVIEILESIESKASEGLVEKPAWQT